MLSCTGVVAIHKTALLSSELFSSLFVLPRFYWIPRIITDSVAAAAARRAENILLKSLWFSCTDSVFKFSLNLSFNLVQMRMKRCRTCCTWAGVQIWPCSFYRYSGEQISSEHWLLLIWYFGDLHLIIHHLHQIISSLSSVQAPLCLKKGAGVDVKWETTEGPSSGHTCFSWLHYEIQWKIQRYVFSRRRVVAVMHSI